MVTTQIPLLKCLIFKKKIFCLNSSPESSYKRSQYISSHTVNIIRLLHHVYTYCNVYFLACFADDPV